MITFNIALKFNTQSINFHDTEMGHKISNFLTKSRAAQLIKS